jgi:hypothetical protein
MKIKLVLQIFTHFTQEGDLPPRICSNLFYSCVMRVAGMEGYNIAYYSSCKKDVTAVR